MVTVIQLGAQAPQQEPESGWASWAGAGTMEETQPLPET